MKTIVLAFLLAFTVIAAESASCIYDQSSNRISCRVENCITELEHSYLHGSARTPWFNLYPRRLVGGYWDYYTKVSEIGCRGGFGLHPGTVSLGCITVTDRSCFNKIKDVVQHFPSRSFDVTECRACTFGRCLGGINTLKGQRKYHTDLQVVA